MSQFVFGASDFLDQLTPVENNEGGDGDSTTTFIGKIMEAMSRKIKGGLTLYYGRFYLPVPHNPRISMVFGWVYFLLLILLYGKQCLIRK